MKLSLEVGIRCLSCSVLAKLMIVSRKGNQMWNNRITQRLLYIYLVNMSRRLYMAQIIWLSQYTRKNCAKYLIIQNIQYYDCHSY